MVCVCVPLCTWSVLSVVSYSLCFELWTPDLHSKWFLPTEIYATILLAAFNIKVLMKYFSLQDESSSTTNLCVEDLQKNKDSNSIIKDRLSQTVRQNSKSFFDPVRKCNGQPVPFQQPKHFTGGVMRWYQVEGMEWLRVMNCFLFLKKNSTIVSMWGLGCAPQYMLLSENDFVESVFFHLYVEFDSWA